MHASLVELLENLKPGLLWTHRDGTVRFANGEGQARTGLAPGRKIYDPDLLRAVSAAVAGGTPRIVTAVGSGDTGHLRCRVIPGLGKDDAFVFTDPGADHDAGIGYDNLMHIIRADLRDPLRKTVAALQLLEGQGGLGPEQQALAEGIDTLLAVAERLVDLASVWDSNALMASDRIELWPLLQRVWGDVEPLAVKRAVKVRFKAQGDTASLAPLYGSEHWLARVFRECLDSAVRGARRGSTLVIEHHQLGPRAVVVFRDSGVFAARDPSQAGVDLKGSTPARAVELSASDQIGLKLCQHVVSLHGGLLRDEQEDGERNFIVELPTGAPHQIDSTQLDIAQAQRYARDLSALMSRARTQRRAAAESAGSSDSTAAGTATDRAKA